MRKIRRGLASFLAVLMLVSVLPTAALAEKAADEVIYNTGTAAVTVGSDPQKAETPGAGYQLFDEHGNYTLELQPDELFPYEVQFTYGGDTWSEYFMDPEDTVEVGGHTFRVHTEQTGTALTQLSVQVGNDTVIAYPEEKQFTDQPPEIGLFSMMPLQEKRMKLDLSGYLREELKEVSISAILGGLQDSQGNKPTGQENIAAWAKWSYTDADGNYVSENDNYTVVKPGDTVDLSSNEYNTSLRLEMIIGTADQLDLSNVRYIVDVSLDSRMDMFTAQAATKDRTLMTVKSVDVGRGTYPDTGKERPILDIRVAKADVEHAGEAYVSLSLADPNLEKRFDVKVVKGIYETVEELKADSAAVEITDQIWNVPSLTVEGGHLADYSYHQNYEGNPEITVVFVRKDDLKAVKVMPLTLNMSREWISLSTGSICAERDSGGRTYVQKSSTQKWNGKYSEHTYFLENGYPANGTYYVNLHMYNPANQGSDDRYGLKYVKKAVVGYYQTEADIPTSAPDIKDQLFSDPYREGYGADFSNGVIFTVVNTLDDIEHIKLTTKESEPTPEVPDAPKPGSRDTYFEMRGVNRYSAYVMPYDADSYYYNGYQTILLLNRDGTPVTDQTIVPWFQTGSGVEMFAGHNGASGTKQVSGTTEIPFESGKVIQYSAAAQNGTDLKNYWVTFLTRQSGPKLFVNATNDTENDADSVQYYKTEPVREVFLTDEYDYHHDVFFANIGDVAMDGLYVRLENPENIALDEYWTIGATKTLSAFTTTQDPNSYDKLKNTAKIRLVPVKDGEGKIQPGVISGTLVIGYTGNAPDGGEEVRIKLTGVSGIPKITTTSIVDGVKYVPYASMIQTNNMGASDSIKFAVTAGTLPDGIELQPNGKLYGVPKMAGDFTFTVMATYNDDPALSDSKEFTMTIRDNTDANVDAATDHGYTLMDRVPSDIVVENGNCEDAVMRSEGAYGTFYKFYLDGQELTEGEDYRSEEGSTKITIFSQTFKKAGNGSHTIAAEFRTKKTDTNTVKRAAQNYKISGLGGGGGDFSGGGGSSGGGSSSGNTSSSYTVSVNTVEHGSISVSPKSAVKDQIVTISVEPDKGYELKSLVVTDHKGKSVAITEKGGKYTFKMPDGTVNIKATFAVIGVWSNHFVDVQDDAYYFDAVAWANRTGIMAGTSATTFSPDENCTRAQMVTFLWHAAGSPEPVSSQKRFTDVPVDSFYAKAALWAAEQGITAGTSVNQFSPDAGCTRAQAVAFLYRSQNAPAVGGGAAFEDVASDAYYANAVSWAAQNGITGGTGENTFSPDASCTRAQIVTFLYRTFVK